MNQNTVSSLFVCIFVPFTGSGVDINRDMTREIDDGQLFIGPLDITSTASKEMDKDEIVAPRPHSPW
jgi:hypothetical protein